MVPVSGVIRSEEKVGLQDTVELQEDSLPGQKEASSLGWEQAQRKRDVTGGGCSVQ